MAGRHRAFRQAGCIAGAGAIGLRRAGHKTKNKRSYELDDVHEPGQSRLIELKGASLKRARHFGPSARTIDVSENITRLR
jgi:hypothetical protein